MHPFFIVISLHVKILEIMYVKQLYTGCISEAAYFIESNGEAAVIDPLRDIDVYIELAKERNAVIKYIFETHFHADFVSGHLDLSSQTGATIVYGPKTDTNLPVHIASDGETFKIGNVTIKAIHTPGHTIESTCYLLIDEDQKANAIFSGDTLFVNDVGRPDLSSGDLTSEELASIMYDTIQNKLLPLPDDIIVYPAHGPGSSCGKNLGPDTYTTIGDQKKTNYALQQQTRDEFIKAVTTGLTPPPVYFAINAKINKEGYENLTNVKAKALTPLTIDDLKNKIKEDVIILDTRNTSEFTEGFIPGSIFIGLEGRFAEWAGTLLPFHQRIVLVTEPGKEEETIIRMARVGFNNVEGFLAGGFTAWKNTGEKIDMIIDVEADELALDIKHDPNIVVIDVRRETEYGDGHVKDATNLPLAEMTDLAQIANFEENQNLYIHCGGGYRSVIAASLMKRQGINNLRNVLGGWDKIKEESSIKIEKDASVLN